MNLRYEFHLKRLVAYTLFLHKSLSQNMLLLCAFCCVCNDFLKDKIVNLVLPCNLMPFKKAGNTIFRIDKARLVSHLRLSRIFSDIENKPVYNNRPNLKKLVVRTKVG